MRVISSLSSLSDSGICSRGRIMIRAGSHSFAPGISRSFDSSPSAASAGAGGASSTAADFELFLLFGCMAQ